VFRINQDPSETTCLTEEHAWAPQKQLTHTMVSQLAGQTNLERIPAFPRQHQRRPAQIHAEFGTALWNISRNEDVLITAVYGLPHMV
jgi:hypothetical protein